MLKIFCICDDESSHLIISPLSREKVIAQFAKQQGVAISKVEEDYDIEEGEFDPQFTTQVGYMYNTDGYIKLRKETWSE